MKQNEEQDEAEELFLKKRRHYELNKELKKKKEK